MHFTFLMAFSSFYHISVAECNKMDGIAGLFMRYPFDIVENSETLRYALILAIKRLQGMKPGSVMFLGLNFFNELDMHRDTLETLTKLCFLHWESK